MKYLRQRDTSYTTRHRTEEKIHSDWQKKSKDQHSAVTWTYPIFHNTQHLSYTTFTPLNSPFFTPHLPHIPLYQVHIHLLYSSNITQSTVVFFSVSGCVSELRGWVQSPVGDCSTPSPPTPSAAAGNTDHTC